MTVFVDRRAKQEQDLGELLVQLQEQTKTGTLKLDCGNARAARTKYVYLKRGTVELLKATHSRTLLGKALLKRHKLTQQQLNAALERQKAADNSLRLGEILVGMGIVKESDVHQALAYQVAEEIFELFTWERIEGEFVRGEPPLDIFEREDLQARVSLSPTQLARQAEKRVNELSEIRRTLPSKQDVYAPGPRAFRPENEQNPAIHEVLSCLDSKRSVEELLDVVHAPDLIALRVLARMVLEGDAVPLNAAELLAIGQELEDRGEFERARDRYLRVEELGYPDFDLPRRIGQIAEALGELPEACRRYIVYADRCDQSGYPDVAVATLQRVLDLDSEQMRARELYAELLTKSARSLRDGGNQAQSRELAQQAAAEYESVLSKVDNPEDRRRILHELVDLLPEREDLRERIASVSIELGDVAQAVLEYQELAGNALMANDLERAVQVLEKVIELDPDDIMALQSLGDTYAKLGRRQDAVAQYLRFAQSLESSGLAAASAGTLVDIYEKVLELDPDNTSARRFLAKAYEGKEHADKAVANYTQIVESLRRKGGPDAELFEALSKLSALKPTDLALALERARLAKQLGRGDESLEIFRSVADMAQVQGDDTTSVAALKELLNESPGDLQGHLSLARLQIAAGKEERDAGRRCAAVYELSMVSGRVTLAYEAVKLALDAEPDEPRHRERLARVQVARERADEAARTLVRAARRARDDEDLGLCRAWARRALDLDSTCDDARDLLESLRRPRANEDAPVVAEQRPQKTVQATITGGGSSPSIQGITTKTRRLGNIADRLRNMKLGPSTPQVDEGEAEESSRKASSAMSKLRALRGGATPPPANRDQLSKGPEAEGAAADEGVSKKASSALNKLRSLRSGATPDPGADAGEKKVSKGPEAEGEPADEVVSQKASSALNKLRSLRSGATPTPSADLAEKKVSKGPEAAGDPVDEVVSKKASSALNKLRSLRSGAAPSPTPASSKPVSKGPEAEGEPADEVVSKKASSALSKLRALRGGAPPASTPAATAPASKGPEAPGEALDEGVSKKASSALNKLKALRSGGGSPPAAATAPVSKGPEAAGEAVDAGVSKKASSALNKLKALRSGGGSPSPSAAAVSPASKGPEAPGETADVGVSKKASSALSKLKALRSGGGSPPATAAAAPVSKGPEAAGEVVEEAVSKKASSALSRLKALRSGGATSPSPAPAKDSSVSKGPEAPGEVVEEAVSKKASSAMSRLRALKMGGEG